MDCFAQKYTHNFDGVGSCKHKYITTFTMPNGYSLASVQYALQEDMDSLTVKRKGDKWHWKCVKGHYSRKDYKDTDYDLGHFTPFKIMSFCDSAAHESFLYTNQAPQLAYFNEQTWKHLEMSVLKGVKEYGNAEVVTGVIYSDAPVVVGKGEVPIPEFFFKAVYFDYLGMVGFIGNNKTGIISRVTVDHIEQKFEDLMYMKVDLFSDLPVAVQDLFESENLKVLFSK